MSPRDIPRRADRPVGITVIGHDAGNHGSSFKHGSQEGHVEQVRAVLFTYLFI